MSMGDECTTGGSQQRQLVKTLISLSLSDLSLSLSLYLSLFLSSLLSLLVYKFPRSSFLFMINNPICPPSPLCLSVSVFLSLYMYTNFPAVLFYV